MKHTVFCHASVGCLAANACLVSD